MTLTRSPWSVTTAGLGAWATESLLAAAEVLLTEPRAAWRLLPSPLSARGSGGSALPQAFHLLWQRETGPAGCLAGEFSQWIMKKWKC